MIDQFFNDDQTIATSRVASVTINKENMDLNVFPNPAKGDAVAGSTRKRRGPISHMV